MEALRLDTSDEQVDEEEEFEYIDSPSSFFPLLSLPKELHSVVCAQMSQADLSRFSRTCRAFRPVVQHLKHYRYRDGEDKTANPFSPPKYLPNDLRTIYAKFPETHSSSFVLNEMKFFVSLLSNCDKLESIVIEFPRTVQEPYCREYAEYDWSGAVKSITEKSASTLRELRLIFYPSASNFGSFDNGENFIQYISSSLTNLRVLDYEENDRGFPEALYDTIVAKFCKLTQLQTLIFITPSVSWKSCLDVLQDMQPLSSSLQTLCLSSNGRLEISKSLVDTVRSQNIRPFNLVWRLYHRETLLQRLILSQPPEVVSDWFELFEKRGYIPGHLAWDTLLHQHCADEVKQFVWSHPWSGPAIRAELKHGTPPEQSWLKPPTGEALFGEILDTMLEAAVRSRNSNDKSFFLPSNCISTLEMITEICIHTGHRAHLKPIFMRVPFLHVQCPRLIPLLLQTGYVPIIQRICNTRYVPAKALEEILCTSAPECDGPLLCHDAYTNKQWPPANRRQIVKALVDAGAPVNHVDLELIDPDIVAIIVQSKKYFILPELVTAHVVKSLSKAKAPPEVLKRFASCVYKDKLIHMLEGYEHKAAVLECAKKRQI